MIRDLGIDPSLRHTGLCLREGGQSFFHEIKTDKMPFTSSISKIREELREFLPNERPRICVERQLSVGAHSSSTQFAIQVIILNEMQQVYGDEGELFFPLPVQLISYLKKVHGLKKNTATEVVNLYKELTGRKGRISQHCVDAWFLTEMARDKTKYKLPSNEKNITPWSLLYGY